jgi:hypothetical protein
MGLQMNKMPPTEKKKKKKKKKNFWWVALELFFVYSKSRIANSLQQMAKQHATTLKSKACSMGRLANVIWGDHWDAKYFVNNSTKMSFGKLIHDMYDPIQRHKELFNMSCTN